jgi:hypothetical protein
VTLSSVPLPVQQLPVQSVPKQKYYSKDNVEMKFGVCWGFQYGDGCKEGPSCAYPGTHACGNCGLQHATKRCPSPSQMSPMFLSSQVTPQVMTKPAPEHTVTSSAVYQEVQDAPIMAQLALSDTPFVGGGSGRTSDRKSSTSGRSSHK